MTSTYPELVETSLINAAGERQVAAIARLKTAEADFVAASAAVKDAEAASKLAVSGAGSLSPADAELRLETAERALRIAGKVHDASKAEFVLAGDNIRVARGEAHQPVYRRGIELRFAAAKKADAARAILAEAERDHKAANALIQEAASAGTPHVGADGWQSYRMDGCELETRLWGQGCGWWNGISKAGIAA